MQLIVFRHGNTFAPGAPVVCAGRQAHLPLVALGVAQAHAAAAALQRAQVVADATCASPRARAQQFAAVLHAGVGGARAVTTDARLDEVDYGPWTGRTRADIVAAGGAEQVHAWDVLGQWPEGAGWGEGEAQVRAQLHAFADDCAAKYGRREKAAQAVVVAVSHAGRMRYLLDLCRDVPAAVAPTAARKVGCGHAVVLAFAEGAWRLVAWNVAPAALAAALQQQAAG